MLSRSSTILSRSSTRYTTPEAVALHESVPPDRWCVTREDLWHLRAEVWRAIQFGEILPPSDGTDDFQCSDELYGPSIYTVNKQHIVPVTESAGKVSWALMRHPEGLDCDLFISHAWQEGVFEFVSKVLHSWPGSAKHAWCCMLANPQNLDIGALLQSPSNSPFALALKASTWVLVVPNRHCSIYTRLWCGYEAYCAQEEGKIIFIAQASHRKRTGIALLWVTLAGLLGVALGACMKLGHLNFRPTTPLCIAGLSYFFSAMLNSNRYRVVLNRTGALACGFMFLQWHTVFLPNVQNTPVVVSFLLQRMLFLIGVSGFCLLEVDRINGQARMEEALQLSRGFQGTIKQATCSRPADAAHIFAEIGDKTDLVDHAIGVLLTAGMSSPLLREVASAGVNIQDAGSAEVAIPWLALFGLGLRTLLLILANIVYVDGMLSLWFIRCISLLSRVGLLIILLRSPRDERCLILKMMTKLIAAFLICSCPLVVIWELRTTDAWAPHPAWMCGPMLIYLIILGFACLGMRRLVSSPCLLQFFLARGRDILPSSRCFKRPPALDRESSASSEDSSE